MVGCSLRTCSMRERVVARLVGVVDGHPAGLGSNPIERRFISPGLILLTAQKIIDQIRSICICYETIGRKLLRPIVQTSYPKWIEHAND
jgi:hypothetical protein